MKPTKSCTNCFKDNDAKSFHDLFLIDNFLCSNCLFKMKPFFKKFKLDNIKGLAIFPYKDYIKEIIFRYKGCYDYELRNVFISTFKKELQIRYKNYFLVPSPSHKDSNELRGFNHVVEAFKILELPMLDLLEKTEDICQHNLGYKERLKVSKILKLKSNESLEGKNILLVDDIVTTGSTLRASIKLIESLHPKHIEILVIAKTEFTKEEKAKLPKDYPILD